jgi:hypothetical protein
LEPEGSILEKFIKENLPKGKVIKTWAEEEMGMSKQNLYGLFKSKKLEPETKKKFEDYFGKSIFPRETLTKGQDSQDDGNTQPDEKQNDLILRSLNELIQSNKLLAEQSIKLAEGNTIQANNHKELIELVRTIEGRTSENLVVLNATVKGIQKFVLGLSLKGHKQFQSLRDAEEALNKEVSGNVKSKPKKGIHDGSGT